MKFSEVIAMYVRLSVTETPFSYVTPVTSTMIDTDVMVSAEWHRRSFVKIMDLSVNFLLGYFLPLYVIDVEEFNGVTLRTLPPPVDLENPLWTGSTRTLRLPIFSSGGILWYYLYLYFGGRGIQCWHFQNSNTTGWPRKSSLNRKYPNFEGTHLFLWWNFMILPIFIFSRSGNSKGNTFRILTPPVDLENPVWTGSTRTLRLPIFFSGGILWYYLYLYFRGQGIQWWHFQNSNTTGWPRKSSLNRKYPNFEVTHLFLWWNFMILPIFIFWRSGNSMMTLSEF